MYRFSECRLQSYSLPLRVICQLSKTLSLASSPNMKLVQVWPSVRTVQSHTSHILCTFHAHLMLIMLHIMFYCNSQPQNAWNILFIVLTRRHRVILHQTTGWFLSFSEENRIFMFQSIQAEYKTKLTQCKSVERTNKHHSEVTFGKDR